MYCMRLTANAGPKKSRQKSPSGHHCTTLSDYIFATKAHIHNRKKKLVKQQYLLHMSSQYGELRPTSDWDRFVSLGTPGNFNGFHVLAALLHGTLVVGVSQTLRRWTEGTTYIWQGGHHVGHWPTFLVPHQLLLMRLTRACHPTVLINRFCAPDILGCIWIAWHRLHPESVFPDAARNSMFGEIPEYFPGLWPPCCSLVKWVSDLFVQTESATAW